MQTVEHSHRPAAAAALPVPLLSLASPHTGAALSRLVLQCREELARLATMPPGDDVENLREALQHLQLEALHVFGLNQVERH